MTAATLAYPSTPAPTSIDERVAPLRELLTGDLVTADHPEYDTLRRVPASREVPRGYLDYAATAPAST